MTRQDGGGELWKREGSESPGFGTLERNVIQDQDVRLQGKDEFSFADTEFEGSCGNFQQAAGYTGNVKNPKEVKETLGAYKWKDRLTSTK